MSKCFISQDSSQCRDVFVWGEGSLDLCKLDPSQARGYVARTVDTGLIGSGQMVFTLAASTAFDSWRTASEVLCGLQWVSPAQNCRQHFMTFFRLDPINLLSLQNRLHTPPTDQTLSSPEAAPSKAVVYLSCAIWYQCFLKFMLMSELGQLSSVPNLILRPSVSIEGSYSFIHSFV